MGGNYHPEPYWSEVAKRIRERHGQNVIAGDDEPYYRYKRKRFLEMLDSLDVKDKSVLEIGHGPGGNLRFIYEKRPSRLEGVDISSDMVEMATKNLEGRKIGLTKINGTQLPFEDQTFDLVFSATVLQHNTDEEMMAKLLTEMCRVSKHRVVLFERVDKTLKGDELCKGRPVDYYGEIVKKSGFTLEETEFINIHLSYLVCGAIRKGLNSKRRKEGEPLNSTSEALQKLNLSWTRWVDPLFKVQRDVAKMVFKRS